MRLRWPATIRPAGVCGRIQSLGGRRCGVVRRIRLCRRATGAADFAKGACASVPQRGASPVAALSVWRGKCPLAQCEKLRGFGGGAPMPIGSRICAMAQVISPRLPWGTGGEKSPWGFRGKPGSSCLSSAGFGAAAPFLAMARSWSEKGEGRTLLDPDRRRCALWWEISRCRYSRHGEMGPGGKLLSCRRSRCASPLPFRFTLLP